MNRERSSTNQTTESKARRNWSRKNQNVSIFLRLGLSFRCLKSSEKQIVGVASGSGRINQSQSRFLINCDWSILPLLVTTPAIWFSLHRKRRNQKHNRKKYVNLFRCLIFNRSSSNGTVFSFNF